MSGDVVSFRFPSALSKALKRLARDRDVPGAQIVREAVAAYLLPGRAEPRRTVRASELAILWPSLPKLGEAEASNFESDITAARTELGVPGSPWD